MTTSPGMGQCLHMPSYGGTQTSVFKNQVVVTGYICGLYCISYCLVMAYPVSDNFYSSSFKDLGLSHNEWKLKFSPVAGNNLEFVSN